MLHVVARSWRQSGGYHCERGWIDWLMCIDNYVLVGSKGLDVHNNTNGFKNSTELKRRHL